MKATLARWWRAFCSGLLEAVERAGTLGGFLDGPPAPPHLPPLPKDWQRELTIERAEMARQLDELDRLRRGRDALILAGRPRVDVRICAVCLADWPRADYNRHMRDDHGYELLNLEPVDKPKPPV